MSNIYEKVTNISVLDFFRENENGTKTSMIEVLNNIRFTPEAVKVYNFNLASGTVKARTLNLFYSKTDSVKFVSQYLRYWYYLERDAIATEYDKFVKAQGESGEEIPEERIECVRIRYDNVMKALENFNNVRGVCSTVSLLVCADRKVKSEKWSESIHKAFKPVDDILNTINKSECDEKAANLKPLRAALRDFCQAVWTPTEDGTIAKYTYNANARLTEEVFRVSMRGRERTKSGKIGTKYAKDFELLREITYACFEELQKKDKELVADLSAPIEIPAAPAANESNNG